MAVVELGKQEMMAWHSYPSVGSWWQQSFEAVRSWWHPTRISGICGNARKGSGIWEGRVAGDWLYNLQFSLLNINSCCKGSNPKRSQHALNANSSFSLSSAKRCWVPLLLIPRRLSYTLTCLMPKIHSEMLNFNNLLLCCQAYYSLQVS